MSGNKPQPPRIAPRPIPLAPNTVAQTNVPPRAAEASSQSEPFDAISELRGWFNEAGRWYCVSTGLHMAAVVLAGLLLGDVAERPAYQVHAFDTVLQTVKAPEPTPTVDLVNVPIESTPLDDRALGLTETPPIEQLLQTADVIRPEFASTGGGIAAQSDLNLGGLGGFDVQGVGNGPLVRGNGGVGLGVGTGIGAGFGGSGTGAVTFFNSTTQAKRIYFIVDASTSMEGRRWEQCKQEILTSVSKLTPEQRFFVSFFSDADYPMFTPTKVAGDLLPLSSNNWEQFQRWVETIRLVPETKPRRSLQRAFNMKPDVIYLLTDGDFNDDTYSFLMNSNERKIRINTIGFDVESDSRDTLKRIAEKFRGTYTEAKSTPGT